MGSPVSADGSSIEMGDLLAPVRRWSWLLLLAAVLGGVLGYLYAQSQPKRYAATTSVLVTPTGADNNGKAAAGRTGGEVNLDTEARLLTSAKVAVGAKDLLRSPASPQDLVSDVSVTVPSNTTILAVRFLAASPLAAQQGSHAFAQAYLNARVSSAKSNIEGQVGALRQQIQGLQKQLEAVSGTAVSLPSNSPTKTYAQAQQTVLVSQLSGLQSTLDNLLSTEVTPGTILSDAVLPTSPSSPHTRLDVAGGAMAALLAALGAALLLERRRRRVERWLDVPIWARVPRGWGRRQGNADALHATPGGEAVALRNAVVAELSDGGAIVVTATDPNGDRGETAAQLAVALAHGGYDTVVLSTQPGSAVSELLTGQAPTAGTGAATDTAAGNAAVPSGRTPGDDALPTLRAQQPPLSPRLKVVVAEDQTAWPIANVERALLALRDMARYVVLDARPLAMDPDTELLVAQADAVVLAVATPPAVSGERLRAAGTLARRRPAAGAVLLPRSARHAAPPDAGRTTSPAQGDMVEGLPAPVPARAD